MCGIGGFNFKDGEMSEGARAIIAHVLAIGNDKRGGDSWGFYTPEDNGNYRVERGLKHLSPNVSKMIGLNTVMMHTRLGTHGSKTVENAHPFEIGNIIGAHNGVIFNHDDLCKEFDRNFEVDSMHIFAHLDEGKPFDDIHGYGAIEWVDNNDLSKINLCKISDNGSLSVIAVGPDKDHVKGIIWSSEKDHIKTALERAGVEDGQWFNYDITVGQAYYVMDGEFYINNGIKYEVGTSYKTIPQTGHTTSYGNGGDRSSHYRHNWNESKRDSEYLREIEEDKKDCNFKWHGEHHTFEEWTSYVDGLQKEQEKEAQLLLAEHGGES